MQFPWKNIHFRQTIKATLVGPWLLSWYYTDADASSAWQRGFLVAKQADHPPGTPSPNPDQQTTLWEHPAPTLTSRPPSGDTQPLLWFKTPTWKFLAEEGIQVRLYLLIPVSGVMLSFWALICSSPRGGLRREDAADALFVASWWKTPTEPHSLCWTQAGSLPCCLLLWVIARTWLPLRQIYLILPSILFIPLCLTSPPYLNFYQ